MASEPRQVLHVRENSKEAMDQLFEVLKKENAHQKSLRDRMLPQSFFKQPNRPHPNHSRENSQDSQLSRVQPQLTPNHSRSHSSPAQFISSNSLSVPNPHHGKQQSVDILDDPNWNQDQRHLHNFHQQFRYETFRLTTCQYFCIYCIVYIHLTLSRYLYT